MLRAISGGKRDLLAILCALALQATLLPACEQGSTDDTTTKDDDDTSNGENDQSDNEPNRIKSPPNSHNPEPNEDDLEKGEDEPPTAGTPGAETPTTNTPQKSP